MTLNSEQNNGVISGRTGLILPDDGCVVTDPLNIPLLPSSPSEPTIPGREYGPPPRLWSF